MTFPPGLLKPAVLPTFHSTIPVVVAISINTEFLQKKSEFPGLLSDFYCIYIIIYVYRMDASTQPIEFSSATEEIEEQRLRALKSYNVLDTAAEQEFDELVSLASYICGTPISLISLITHDRQWFKARVGLSAPETPRSVSFCQHAIASEDILEIPDALEDIRFYRNPMVTGNPHIRFYAGAPLVNAEGHKLGTLCVIDTEPRELSEAQKIALSTLSKQVMVHLELRLKKQQVEHEKQQLRAANARLSQFASAVSHGLKEPLLGLQATLGSLEGNLAGKDFTLLGQNVQELKERARDLDVLVSGLRKQGLRNMGF
jgi:GAF domain-containing protein